MTFNDSGWYTCTPYNENGPGVQSNLMTVAASGKYFHSSHTNHMKARASEIHTYIHTYTDVVLACFTRNVEFRVGAL